MSRLVFTESEAQALIDLVRRNQVTQRLGGRSSFSYGPQVSKSLVQAIKRGMTAADIASGMTATAYLKGIRK